MTQMRDALYVEAVVPIHPLLLFLVTELGFEAVVRVGLSVGGGGVLAVFLVTGVVHGLSRGRLGRLKLVGHSGRALETRW